MTSLFAATLKSEKFGIWHWIAILTLGMLFAAIPGFMLAPYSINSFDEPYQILNAYDWENAIYAPLSSRLANWFGNAVGWKYLAFRYLALALNFTAIYITAMFALICSNRKRKIVVWSVIFTLLGLTFKTMTGYYGWDNWTACFLASCIILFFSLADRFTWGKLLLLGAMCGLTILMRIPNMSLLFFGVILLALISKSKNRTATVLVFILTVLTVDFLVVSWLYGDFSNYLNLFKTLSINSHNPEKIVRPFFTRFALVMIFSALFYLGFRWLKIKSGSGQNRLFLISCVLTLVFTLSLLPSIGASFGMGPAYSYGIILFSLIFLFKRGVQKKDRKLTDKLLILFILSTVTAIGSNVGFTKVLIWPVLPLIIYLLENRFSRSLNILFYCWASAYFIYSIIGITQYNYMDEKIGRLSYRFNDKESVLYGMHTTPEQGEFITEIYRDVKSYEEKGFRLIVLKQGNDYLYEYLFGEVNRYQRHNFGNWYAFWDDEYIDAIRNDINNADTPVIVLYRQWKGPDDMTPMLRMLETNAECVIDKPGYSIWKK